MAATIYNDTTATAVTHGLTTETALIINGYSTAVKSKTSEIEGPDGEVVAVSKYGITRDVKVDGYSNGDASVVIAGLLTLANDANGLGFTSGTNIIGDISETKAVGQFKKISFSVTGYTKTMTLRV